MDNCTAVIRSLDNGSKIKVCLDVKLSRTTYQAMLVSSVISDDPDFAPAGAAGKDTEEVSSDNHSTLTGTLTGSTYVVKHVRSIQSLRSTQSHSTTALPSAGSYHMLTSGALSLDRTLYSVLCTLIIGTKSVLLDYTHDHSYIQGMCLLFKHCEISRNDRIYNAFAAMNSIKYGTCAQSWATSSIAAVRELFNSKASMMHYCLTKIMHSLDGKHKTVQYKIAEDLNALAPDDDVNIYDLIQVYATMIASVGDTSNKPVMAVEDDDCHYCGEKGHHEHTCSKKKEDAAIGKYEPVHRRGKGGRKNRSRDKWKLKCTNCGMKGHTADKCRNDKVNTAQRGSVEQPSNSVTEPEHAKVENQEITQASLAAYLTQLHRGAVPVQRFVCTQGAHAEDMSQCDVLSPQITLHAPRPVLHQVGHKGERVGEASHPGPSGHFIDTRSICERRSPILSMMLIGMACVLSLCDGMGCGLMSLRANGVSVDQANRYIAVEIDADARAIAKNANPDKPGLPRIDHSWHSNVYNITEEDIERLGHNSIKMFLAGPPCQDFSKLRLIVRKRSKSKMNELRPGLNGPHGRVFRQVLQILQWVLKHNPDCEYLIENVDFSDLGADWGEVCDRLGSPMLIDAQMYSFTRRYRAYWSNFVRGRDMPPPGPRLDPNMCLVNGRTAILSESRGRMSMNQIGGSWRGNPEHPYASTARPVLVFDPAHEKPQHLFPEEAEQLHGMEPGCTAGRGITNRQRLEAIGRGWDVNVTSTILSFSKLFDGMLQQQQDEMKPSSIEMHRQQGAAAIMQVFKQLSPEQAAECLMELEPSTRSWYLSLLESELVKNSDDTVNSGCMEASAELNTWPSVDADGPGVTGIQCRCNQTVEPECIEAFAGMNTWPSMEACGPGVTETQHDEEQSITVPPLRPQEAIRVAFNNMKPEDLAGALMQLEPNARDWYMSVLATQCLDEQDGSVLDSGSSRHLQSRVCVTDAENLTPLSGFNGSTQWTEGSGYVPGTMQDSITGKQFKIDFDQVDLMTTGLVSDILSLGKLLRDGWEFHLSSHRDECYGITPGGAHRVEVKLGEDDILRILHSFRSGSERMPLPNMPAESTVNTIKRSAGDASSQFIHDSFFHRSDEKLYHTLGVTKGYAQSKIITGHCEACAKAKARNFGLSHQRVHNVADGGDAPLDPIFDDDNELDPCDSEPDEEELEYIAPMIGRELGEQNVPRFDLEKLRPFEAMFVDNKDYPCQIRGGAKSCLIFVDYKTRTKHKVDVHNKTQNGQAFKRIVAMEGVHKLPYRCRVFTDGCGSMKHVADIAVALGIDHQYIPPHQQSLNEAEKVCDSTFAEVRAVMDHHNAPAHWFGLMLDYAIYTDIRTATTASREWKTPYEMSRGSPPFIGKIHRPCTRCYVQVPKTKRRQLAVSGLHNVRAEPGRLVGFQGPYSSTYAVILDKQHSRQPERLVHSRNVSFDDNDFVMPRRPVPAERPRGHVDVQTRAAAGSEEANDSCLDSEPAAAEGHYVPVPNRDEHFDTGGDYYDLGDPENQPWFTHTSPPKARPRPAYHKMCLVMKEQAMAEMVMSVNGADSDKRFDEGAKILNAVEPRHETNRRLTQVLAAHAQNDMNWNEALASKDRDLAITALEKELESLTSTILTEIAEGDPDYENACKLATPGRILLGIKRSGMYKARGVKQGFKEDTEQADGPNFNYYAHVAKFNSIRMSTFRTNRGERRIALKDVSTAFLQSDKYPDGTIKYVSFKDPLTKQWRYYKQSGPLYGEKSATKRWEDTIAPWYESIGYQRGENEPCAFHGENSDSLVLLYTDDNFIDADEGDIKWTAEQLDDRFDCKDIEWLQPGVEIDCLGMQLFQTDDFTGFHLEKYIHKTLGILGLSEKKQIHRTPIANDIDGNSTPLKGEKLRLYPTAVGCFGWMANTCRPDIAYAHSRMSQHLANPTESAWGAVERCCGYLRGTADLCIAAPRCNMEHEVNKGPTNDGTHGWQFFSDSDFAGNSEEQNRRRSQNGYVAMLNGAPVLWGSKVSSVAFAHPDIGEAHADISSGAAEVYAAGNATFEFLHLSYTADEMGIPFPQPILMGVDNKAAIAFSDNTAFKTKLKHIDVRQEWVRTLRNKDILQTEHVPSKDNLADIFTKILDADTFEGLRNRMMHKRSAL